MNLNFQLGPLKFSLGKSSLSPDMSAWLRAEDLPDSDGGAKLVTPYAQSAWVYIAVSRLAEKVAQIPFRISRIRRAGGSSAHPASRIPHPASSRRSLGETILDSGPAVDLFARPHPTMPSSLFWEMLVTWLALRGETFILPLDNSDSSVDLSDRSPRVSSLITLPTELFWHIVSGYDLTSWRYTGSPLLTPIPSELLLPSQVIHIRSPNPYLYWRGMSPLIVAMVAAGADYAAAQYSKGYWLNNADTGVIVTTEQQASAEQQAAILAALRERKRKAGTADRPLFLWGGAKVEKPQLSGMESQFIENRKMNRQEIGAIFKVPDSIMGFNEAKASALSGGGAAISAEQVGFIENTIAPICRRLESGLAPIVATFGDDLVGWFDLDSLPIMQQARRDRLDAAGKAFSLGIPLNDLNTAYDLGFPEYPWGKTGYLPCNLQPAGEPTVLPAEDDPTDSETPTDEDQSGMRDAGCGMGNPFARLGSLLSSLSQPLSQPLSVRKVNIEVLWHSHVAIRRKSVKLFKSKVSKIVMQFRAMTLAKLSEVHLNSLSPPLSQPLSQPLSIQDCHLASRIPHPASVRSLIDLIFDQHQFGAALATELHNPVLQVLQTAGDELLSEIGSDDPWTLPPAAAKDFLAARTQPIQGVGGRLRDQLNTALQAGLDHGATTSELSNRVRTVFTGFSDYESERVARTEVNLAYNTSRDLAMKAAGINYKAWLSNHVPNDHETHAIAGERYIDAPISIDEPFEVGGDQMMFPGDDSLGADASNLINCQCIHLAAQKKAEDAESTTYHIPGLGRLSFSK